MKNKTKILLILALFVLIGCDNTVTVGKETYDNQIKKCDNNGGVSKINYIVDESGKNLPYFKIETLCNNGAFFKEFYSDKK